jgi:hypothetical protein
MRMSLWITLCLAVVGLPTESIRAQESKPTDVKITLNVEKEGPGGSFAQVGTDLTDSEVALLQAAIEKRMLELPLTRVLVPENYDHTHLFLSIVATKISTAGGKTIYAVSSALSVGKTQTTVGSLTHDVIVESSIDTMARAVVYYLSAVELRGITGGLDK